MGLWIVEVWFRLFVLFRTMEDRMSKTLVLRSSPNRPSETESQRVFDIVVSSITDPESVEFRSASQLLERVRMSVLTTVRLTGVTGTDMCSQETVYPETYFLPTLYRRMRGVSLPRVSLFLFLSSV